MKHLIALVGIVAVVLTFTVGLFNTTDAQTTPSATANIKVTPVASLDYLNKTRVMNKGAVQGKNNADSVTTATVSFVKEVVVMFPIAADTILVMQASKTWQAGFGDTLFYGLTPATAGNPFTIPIFKKLDSTYYVTRTTKGSKLLTIFRSIPY